MLVVSGGYRSCTLKSIGRVTKGKQRVTHLLNFKYISQSNQTTPYSSYSLHKLNITCYLKNITPSRIFFSINNINNNSDSTNTNNDGNVNKKDDENNHLETKVDKRAYPIAFSTFLMGIAIGILIPVMPLFITDLGLSPTSVGMLISILGFTRLLVNLPLASIGDLQGRRPLLVYGPIFSAISLIFTGLSTTLHSLLFWRSITGFSSAAQMTGAQLYLSDISTPRNRARTLAPMGSAWSAGAAIGPAIGGFLAEKYGMVFPFVIVGVSVLLIAGNNYLTLPETRPTNLHYLSYKEQSKKIITHIKQSLFQWKTLLVNKNVQSVVLLHTIFWFMMAGAQLTLLPLLALSFSLKATSVGTIYTILGAIGVVGLHPAAVLSDKYGRIPMMMPGLAMVVGAVFGLMFIQNVAQLYALVVIWGIGGTVMGAGPTAYISDATTPTERSQALALLRSGGDLGMMLGASVSGILANTVGIPAAFGLNAILLTAASGFFWWRASEPSKQ